MAGNWQRRSGDKAVGWLATCLVIVGGGLACTFVISSSSPDPRESFWICGGSLAGVVVLIWLLREKPAENAAAVPFSWLRRRTRRVTQYRIGKRNPHPPAAPPQPPDARQIRELQQHRSTWVPSPANMCAPKPDAGSDSPQT